MNSDSEPIRELECKFDDNWHPSWYSFPSHKIARSKAIVIYHHIFLVLLYLYTL